MNEPPCESCNGACCQRGAHGFTGVGKTVEFAPRCPYLMRDNRCSAYDARPDQCRSFDCRTDENFKKAMGTGPWSTGERALAKLTTAERKALGL